MSNFNSSEDPTKDNPPTDSINVEPLSDDGAAANSNYDVDLLRNLEETLDNLCLLVEDGLVNPFLTPSLNENDVDVNQTLQNQSNIVVDANHHDILLNPFLTPSLNENDANLNQAHQNDANQEENIHHEDLLKRASLNQTSGDAPDDDDKEIIFTSDENKYKDNIKTDQAYGNLTESPSEDSDNSINNENDCTSSDSDTLKEELLQETHHLLEKDDVEVHPSKEAIIISIDQSMMPIKASENPSSQSVSKISIEFTDYDDYTDISHTCGVSSSEGGTKYYVEPTVSTLEREILLRGETCDSNKKAKILQLPPDITPNAATYGKKETVGDDVAKSTAHIFCECEQPGVAGAAVPMIASFTVPSAVKATSNDDDKSRSESKIPLSKKELLCAEGNNSNKPKPSLIPKLSSSFRNEKVNSSTGRADKNVQEVLPNQTTNTAEGNKQLRNISFKKVTLPEKLKGSSTVVRESASNRSIQEKKEVEDDTKQHHLDTEDDDSGKQTHFKKLTSEFSKQVSRLAQEASNLSEIKNPNSQTLAIDSLYKQIVNLKKIANDLKTFPGKSGSETIVLDQPQNLDENQTNADATGKARTKDNNRIYIKFLPSKSTVKKRKSCNSEVQTDFVVATSPEFQETMSLSNEETGAKEVDSMDGMFIPSFDEPPKMEEDDDEEGLDITITFPEMQDTVQEDNLSVCFSTISAEALGRLKRCPKEFTLRMDFIQGKMFFQSGKSPANNFAIGPDLKITEYVIDNKRSDVINIKPSTECLYASQIIPVEGDTTRQNSIKILKSTDSELFNVVSLPFVNKRNSVATKSCITFKNIRRVSSESLLPDRTYYKSMPQIPSLTKILEEPAMETVVGGARTAMTNAEKKPRNRNLQQKRANASLENVLLDPC